MAAEIRRLADATDTAGVQETLVEAAQGSSSAATKISDSCLDLSKSADKLVGMVEAHTGALKILTSEHLQTQQEVVTELRWQGGQFKAIYDKLIELQQDLRTGGGESGLWSAFNHSLSYHRLQVGFGGVCRCMRGDLMWTCLVWPERSTPDKFWVPSHRFNSVTGEQKG